MTSTTITIPCEGSLLPKPADLTNIFNQITNSIATLELAGLPEEAQKVRDILDDIESVLGNFPVSISRPVFGTLEIPEVEWEKRINAMIEEYHLFVQAKFMEIINSVLPISFAVPVPPFGISVDVVQLFSDPAYKGTIKQQFVDEVETFYPMLPDIYKSFDGTYGLESADMKAEAVWEYVMTQLNKGALAILHGAFGGLIDKFSEIWDALGLPSLPGLTNLNVQSIIEGMISSIEDQIKSAPDDLKDELRKQAIAQLESISIVSYSLMDLLGGEPNDFVESMERKMDRFKRRLKNFGEEWPKYLIQEWMQLVQKFFKAIGLGALIEWITFTFCDFLKLIGLPSSITLSTEQIITGVIGATATSLPSLSPVTTVMIGDPDSPDIHEYTASEGQTDFVFPGGTPTLVTVNGVAQHTIVEEPYSKTVHWTVINTILRLDNSTKEGDQVLIILE